MPASTIAQILLRIFGLYWCLQGLIQFSYFAAWGRGESSLWLSLAPALMYLGAGLLAWFSAPLVSRIIVGANDAKFDLTGVTTEQLFSTALLALGVFFALDSFAEVFSWGHYFAASRAAGNEFHKGTQPSYYNLTEAAMTFVAAVGLICTSRRWAKRLCRENSENAALPSLNEESQQG